MANLNYDFDNKKDDHATDPVSYEKPIVAVDNGDMAINPDSPVLVTKSGIEEQGQQRAPQYDSSFDKFYYMNTVTGKITAFTEEQELLPKHWTRVYYDDLTLRWRHWNELSRREASRDRNRREIMRMGENIGPEVHDNIMLIAVRLHGISRNKARQPIVAEALRQHADMLTSSEPFTVDPKGRRTETVKQGWNIPVEWLLLPTQVDFDLDQIDAASKRLVELNAKHLDHLGGLTMADTKNAPRVKLSKSSMEAIARMNADKVQALLKKTYAKIGVFEFNKFFADVYGMPATTSEGLILLNSPRMERFGEFTKQRMLKEGRALADYDFLIKAWEAFKKQENEAPF